MVQDNTLELISRLYLPQQHWAAVESKILRQNKALAAPIVPADQLRQVAVSPSLLGLSDAIGNLTHQLVLDRPIFWCITRARVVNAMIAGYRSPDMYCVVIAEGALDTILNFCAAIMASEPLFWFLSEGTDPVDEMKPPKRSRREAWMHISAEADSRMTDDNMVRSFLLTYIASHYLMAHEIGHLAGGHLPLYTGNFTAEADGSGRPSLAESRALERDADALAAGATSYLLASPDFVAGWADVLKERQAGMRYFLTTAYIFFSVMDLFGPEDPFAIERTHPPALVRVGVMSTMVSLLLDNFGGYTKDEAWELARRSIRAVEIAVMELGGGMMTAEEVALLDADLERNLREHADAWPTLSARLDRGHLEKYWWSQGLR